MTGDQIVSLAVASVALVVALVSGIFMLINRHRGDRAALRRQQLPTYEEVVDRLERIEDTFARHRIATGNALSDAERQWPRNMDPPRFDPADLQELGDAVPRAWRRPKIANGR
jgi:hypothetical protein